MNKVNSRLLFGDLLTQNNPPNIENGIVKLSGLHKQNRKTFDLNESILSKHTCILGSSGTGKTNLILQLVKQIKEKMSNEDVMIIYDSKGDFYKEFKTDTDLVLGVSKEQYNQSERWNLFKEVLADGFDEKNYILNVQELCRSFFKERIKNSTNSFFPTAASQLLECLLIAFIRDNINDLKLMNERFFNNYLNKILFSLSIDDIIENLSYHSDLKFACTYIQNGSAQSQGVISELYSVLRELLVGVFAEKGAFSTREFIRNKGGRTLFIEYDLSIGNVLEPIYGLLFDLAIKEALSRSHAKGNVYFIADEFSLLPALEHIQDVLNFGRSLGVKFFAGVQNIDQIKKVYGEETSNYIISGFSSLYTFYINDTNSRKFVIDLMGKNILSENYSSLQKYIEEKREGNVVEDWDVEILQLGEAIVKLPFYRPFKFKFDLFT